MLKAAIVIAILVYIYTNYFRSTSEPPTIDLSNKYWGDLNKKEDSSIRPFQIDVPQKTLDDLMNRLDNTRNFVKPLEKAGWTYGISTEYLKHILNYWRNNYNWKERKALLNKYPHFVTDILGLTIHFQHIKPDIKSSQNLKVIPVLIVHGWPGSIVEFQKLIPLLTTPRPNQDFIFELVIPSIPGYGFSDGSVRPGLGCVEIAPILKTLMSRLGHEKFYAQGGDWGAAITTNLAAFYPEKIKGLHLNMCMAVGPNNFFWNLLGSISPSLVVSPEHQSKMYPLSRHFSKMIEESGYMHIQATKPDTIGTALSDSPAALAAYILEKFSTWTNDEYKYRDDGGLLEKFKIDELLDNLMIYWITNSITTSQRLYAESFSSKAFDTFRIPVTVPTACANFPHELMYQPESLVSARYKNIIQFNHMPRGGHFAAFEEPHLLADDFWTFIEKCEAIHLKK